MIIRVLVLVGVLAPFALPDLALITLPGLLISIIAMIWLLVSMRHMRSGQEQGMVDGALSGQLLLRNPFDMRPAFLLAALVMVMTLIAHWVLDRYGHA